MPARTIRFTHTSGLGGSSLVLVTIFAATGILMMLAYQPAPGLAHDSILTLENDVRFGPLVRGIHCWDANLLVVVLLAHACRVFLTGGYHGPRQLNWVVGVSLLGVVLANSFLRPRQRDAASASLFVAGPVDRFEPGSVTAVPAGR